MALTNVTTVCYNCNYYANISSVYVYYKEMD